MKNKARLILFLGMAAATTCLASAEQEASITHRMMLLAMQLGAILFMAKLGALLFERLHLPGVLGELSAGMLIGPFLLGAVALPGLPHGLFPLGEGFPLSPELYGICMVGSVVLLFMVGLETDLQLFLRYSAAGSVIGIGGVVASFVLGNVTTMLFGPLVFGRPLGFFDAPCMFLGVLSTATSVGITARVLSDHKKLDSPEGVTILSGAVIDDVLGIILLAVVLGVISASKATGSIHWGHIGLIAAKAIGIWLLATTVGLLTARRLSVLLKLFRSRSTIAILSLGLALILAGLFEEAGLAMIIGAYVMGLSLSRTDISRVIQEKLEVVGALLVPVFFCAMGMLVDFHAVGSWQVLLFAGVFSVMAVLAKILGCSVPALFMDFNRLGALRIGAGMVPRGEVALIIAGIGLAAGVLERRVFGVAILMTLLTTLLAPVLLVMLLKRPGRGTRREVKRPDAASMEFDFPSTETASLLLGKILDGFKDEGFFVHSLEHDTGYRAYQLLLNDMVIGVALNEQTLHFTCDARDRPLVNAAVYEVFNDFQHMLQELVKPIDRERLRGQMQSAGQAGRQLKMADFLRVENIDPHMENGSKEEIIAHLLDLLVRNGDVTDREECLRLLLDREKTMSTGLEQGLALPHARTDSVGRIVCALGIRREGVAFDSLDGQPSHFVVLELAPRSENTPHLQFMSTVAQVFQDDRRERLLASPLSRVEIYRLLTT